jgi:hypothetical protein
MARQRFIHPDIWSDPTLGKLTIPERLMFIGCFSNADDEGRLLGNAAYLRSTIFPYDDLSIDEVVAMRDHIVAVCKNLVYYTVDEVEYLAFRKWNDYQKPKYAKPSKLPAPPEDNIGESFPEDFSNVSSINNKASPKTEESLEKALLPRLGLDRVCVRDVSVSGEDDDGQTDDINLYAKWEKTIGGICPPSLYAKFESYTADGMERAVISWAIGQSLGADKPQHYVISVLNDLMTADPPILTMSALRQRERQRKARADPKQDDSLNDMLTSIWERRERST